MKKTLKKISQAFKNEIQTRFERHVHNIEKGEKIKIDGKEFVKIKLKFVDTMDFNLAKHVDSLETENILLKNDLKELIEKSEKCNVKIEQLQICTKNMFRENTKLKEQNHKDETIAKLTKQINEHSEEIEIRNKNISSQGNKIKELESEKKVYRKKEKVLNNEIRLLDKELVSITGEYKKTQNQLKIKTKEAGKFKKADHAIESELKNKQLLIETMTEKLFIQKNEIEYLRSKLKETITTTVNTSSKVSGVK